MMNLIEVKNLRLLNKKNLVATMTVVLNDDIEINNCKLVYSDVLKSYKLFFPSTEYVSTKTHKTAYFPLVKLSAATQAKALVAAIEAYEEEK